MCYSYGMENVEIEKRRPGRPATGHQPTRSVRIGSVWDEAKVIAAGRHESINQVIIRALERYVRQHRAERAQP
jgi:hypothetical protein